MNSMYMQTQISELYVPTNSSFFWLALVFASQLGWSRNSQNDAPWMIFDLYYKQIRFAHTSPNTKDKSVIIVQSGPELQSLLSTETPAHRQPPPSIPPQDNNMTIYGYGIPLGTVIPSSTHQLYIDQDVPHHYWISTGLTDVNWTQIDITNADSASYALTASYAMNGGSSGDSSSSYFSNGDTIIDDTGISVSAGAVFISDTGISTTTITTFPNGTNIDSNGNLSVHGYTSFDNGNIFTDGVGGLTATSFTGSLSGT